MGQGNYDHPSYISRQQTFFGKTVAGVGTSAYWMPPVSNMQVRNVAGIVQVAGTGTGANIAVYVGTSSLGAFALGTKAAGSVVLSGDLNTTVTAGGTAPLSFVTVTDATVVASFVGETYLVPTTTWTGQE